MSKATQARPPATAWEKLQAKALMSANPVSLRRTATVREAIELLTDRGFSAAPVIDAAGRPIGVVSRTDILIHEREHVRQAPMADVTEWAVCPLVRGREGFSIEIADPTMVEEIMTPIIFTVTLETPARDVVKQMLGLKVHHLFVVDDEEVLVGVISTLDILRNL
jgi:CBS domain-containing protein